MSKSIQVKERQKKAFVSLKSKLQLEYGRAVKDYELFDLFLMQYIESVALEQLRRRDENLKNAENYLEAIREGNYEVEK